LIFPFVLITATLIGVIEMVIFLMPSLNSLIHCFLVGIKGKVGFTTKLLEMLRNLTFVVQFASFYFRPNKGREQLSLREKETICFLRNF